VSDAHPLAENEPLQLIAFGVHSQLHTRPKKEDVDNFMIRGGEVGGGGHQTIDRQQKAAHLFSAGRDDRERLRDTFHHQEAHHPLVRAHGQEHLQGSSGVTP